MGYTIIGNKIDTDDWNEHPRKTPQEITDNVLAQLAVMKDKPWFRGSIILLHDGGGDRSATVAALPLLITTLRAKGYELVPVSELMGRTTAEVMPPISPRDALAGAYRLGGLFLPVLLQPFRGGCLLPGRRADEREG